MKILTVIIASFLISFSLWAAPLSVIPYQGTTAQSPIKNGCASVTFVAIGYTGVIGNATFSNITQVIPITCGRDGDTLGPITYTVTGGSLFIIETR